MLIKSVSGNTLVVSDASGDHAYSTSPKTKVTLDGKAAKLTDLEPGDDADVEADGQAALRVTATR